LGYCTDATAGFSNVHISLSLIPTDRPGGENAGKWTVVGHLNLLGYERTQKKEGCYEGDLVMEAHSFSPKQHESY
jgi:hypothetical protein